MAEWLSEGRVRIGGRIYLTAQAANRKFGFSCGCFYYWRKRCPQLGGRAIRWERERESGRLVYLLADLQRIAKGFALNRERNGRIGRIPTAAAVAQHHITSRELVWWAGHSCPYFGGERLVATKPQRLGRGNPHLWDGEQLSRFVRARAAFYEDGVIHLDGQIYRTARGAQRAYQIPRKALTWWRTHPCWYLDGDTVQSREVFPYVGKSRHKRRRRSVYVYLDGDLKRLAEAQRRVKKSRRAWDGCVTNDEGKWRTTRGACETYRLQFHWLAYWREHACPFLDARTIKCRPVRLFLPGRAGFGRVILHHDDDLKRIAEGVADRMDGTFRLGERLFRNAQSAERVYGIPRKPLLAWGRKELPCPYLGGRPPSFRLESTYAPTSRRSRKGRAVRYFDDVDLTTIAAGMKSAERAHEPAAVEGASVPAVPEPATPGPAAAVPAAAHAKPTKAARKLSVLGKTAQAMLLVRDDPDRSTRSIAAEVGLHPSTLSRSEEYQRARALAESPRDKMVRGTKDRQTGQLEAWSEPSERDD